MKTIHYGMIGCGMMGHEHIKNISLLEHAVVAAIYEPDLTMRSKAQSLAPNAVLSESLDALLANEQLDCLVIASPNYLHIEQLKQIATLRPLPVLVEKPLATTIHDREFIQQLQESYPAPVWVAMEYRYMPPVAALIEKANAICGDIDMLTIREHRFPFLPKVNDWNRFNAKSGGTLVEKCCHFFDLMALVLNAEPVRVMASAGQAHNHLDEVYDGAVPDIWDHGYVIVDFDSGSRAMLELCMFADGARYQEEISAVGARGKIECFVPGPARFWPTHLTQTPVPKLVLSPRDKTGTQTIDIPVDAQLLEAGDHNGATFFQHRRFQQVVRGTRTPDVTVSDGWRAIAIGMAAQESAQSGRAILLSEWL